MAAQAKTRYTPEEYLALERQAETRSEYVDGEIFVMAGGSRVHNRITLNISRRLDEALDDSPCEVFATDMRVRVQQRRYTYPDVIVACDPLEFEDDQLDTLLNPVVIIEVLSKSTEDYDRGEKADVYRSLPSLRDLVFVHQGKWLVQHYARRTEHEWLLTEYTQPEDALSLTSVGGSLRLADIYRRVSLADESP